jgi:hypothetical protein
MSMLTLNGIVQNVFEKPASTDKATGEIRPATTQAQILAENVLESGEKRLEMVTFRVHAGEAFRKLIGQSVRIPVGVFVNNEKKLQFYSLKADALPQQ